MDFVPSIIPVRDIASNRADPVPHRWDYNRRLKIFACRLGRSVLSRVIADDLQHQLPVTMDDIHQIQHRLVVGIQPDVEVPIGVVMNRDHAAIDRCACLDHTQTAPLVDVIPQVGIAVLLGENLVRLSLVAKGGHEEECNYDKDDCESDSILADQSRPPRRSVFIAFSGRAGNIVRSVY